ncbi:hypothetical protein [Agrobacterium tumefaciens]|uniref:hypothetical protein n=1 Tax=Agrobacterium tumefaciens TaxID=358 RepID=UPI0015730143|nr:hypothetical protein [Agrobacterium tumefaciens]
MANRPQAERASKAQVEQHIHRQQVLGELMIGDHDRPRRIELLITGLALVVVIAGKRLFF